MRNIAITYDGEQIIVTYSGGGNLRCPVFEETHPDRWETTRIFWSSNQQTAAAGTTETRQRRRHSASGTVYQISILKNIQKFVTYAVKTTRKIY